MHERYRGLRTLGPFPAFCAVWAVVIGLHALSIFSFYEPFSPLATALIAASVIVSWLVARRFVPRFETLSPDQTRDSIRRAERFRDVIFVVAGCILIFETIVFDGVPLVWMMTGVPKGYADFGYPTLHGIFNGMLMFVTSASGAFAVLGSRRRRNGALFLLGILVMAVLYSRAMLVITLIQVGGIVLFRLRSHFTVPRAAGLIFLTIAGLFLFGILGNIRSQHELAKAGEVIITPSIGEIRGTVAEGEASPETPAENSQAAAPAPADVVPRPTVTSGEGMLSLAGTGYNPFLVMVAEDSKWIFSFVPTEFLWGYAYITSGYSNLLFNLQIAPSMAPSTTFSKLVPTIVYSALGVEKRIDNFAKANHNFTVSTAFAAPVSDFGYLGFLIAVPLLVGTAAAYRGSRAGSARSLLLYAMLFQSILLTPYIDTVLYTTFALQLALAFLAGVEFRGVRPRKGLRTP